MRVLNIGSLNLDYVYSVDHIVAPGETESSMDRNVFLGGKGINQSMALARAGVTVYHAGLIGNGGQPFLDACREDGIKTDYLKQLDAPDGHTIIQIDKNAQNCILLYGGTNQMLTEEFVDEVLSHFTGEDMLLLQNEVNLLPYIVDKAAEKGMQIALNPSPYNEKLDKVDMSKISIFLINEVEGEQMTGLKAPDDILDNLLEKFPQAKIILTLGSEGAMYASAKERLFQPSFKVKAVDTTAAGDTFTGYFLAGLMEGMAEADILKLSSKASAIAVTRQGAIPSIPKRAEVDTALQDNE